MPNFFGIFFYFTLKCQKNIKNKIKNKNKNKNNYKYLCLNYHKNK